MTASKKIKNKKEGYFGVGWKRNLYHQHS